MWHVDSLDELARLLNADLSRYDAGKLMAHPGIRPGNEKARSLATYLAM